MCRQGGWKLRVLTRNGPKQGPSGAEIKRAWGYDKNTGIVICDPTSPNILQFQVLASFTFHFSLLLSEIGRGCLTRTKLAWLKKASMQRSFLNLWPAIRAEWQKQKVSYQVRTSHMQIWFRLPAFQVHWVCGGHPQPPQFIRIVLSVHCVQVGDAVGRLLSRGFFIELQSRFGNKFYVRDEVSKDFFAKSFSSKVDNLSNIWRSHASGDIEQT